MSGIASAYRLKHLRLTLPISTQLLRYFHTVPFSLSVTVFANAKHDLNFLFYVFLSGQLSVPVTLVTIILNQCSVNKPISD